MEGSCKFIERTTVQNQNKRPLDDVESLRCSHKHPRQLEYISQLCPIDFKPCDRIVEKRDFPGGGERNCGRSCADERRATNIITEVSAADSDEIESSSGVGSASSLSWATISTSEGELGSQCLTHESFLPGLLQYDQPTRLEEMYALVDYPPRRHVPVGPDHQADVPVWSPQSPGFNVDDDYWEKPMGTCLIPMPNTKSLYPFDGREVGHGRADCSCPDEGSVRCVRQHVMEGREKLRDSLGQVAFAEFGFCDMGEFVASKWTEEEEQLFHEVVFTNPASLGKNFWRHLPEVFPSKTRQDLVSYYFNVFMLQRRAEQNRFVPMHADSDNDEWQGSEDGEDSGMTEEEEDSGIESLADGILLFSGNEHEDDSDHGSSSSGDSDGDYRRQFDYLKGQTCCGSATSPVMVAADGRNHSVNGLEDQDLQDDSCTSYESQHNWADSHFRSEGVGLRRESCVELHGMSCTSCGSYETRELLVPDFVYYDAKMWDIGFISAPRKEVDFLSTHKIIEEVFGHEARNNDICSSKETRSEPGFI